MKTREKKRKNLRKYFTMPLTSDEVTTNLSNYSLSDTEGDSLQYVLVKDSTENAVFPIWPIVELPIYLSQIFIRKP